MTHVLSSGVRLNLRCLPFRVSDATEPDGVVHVTEAKDVTTPSEPRLSLQLAAGKRSTEANDV